MTPKGDFQVSYTTARGSVVTMSGCTEEHAQEIADAVVGDPDDPKGWVDSRVEIRRVNGEMPGSQVTQPRRG